MLRKILIVVFAIVLLLTAFLLKTCNDAGEFKTIKPHFNGTQTVISGIIGAEDITIDHENQLAYISADDRFATLNGKGEGIGKLYLLDLKTLGAVPTPIQLDSPKIIHPHGISFFRKDSIPYLYVVDHTGNKHSILLFKGKELAFEKRFEDADFMISPNDVVAIDENHFYFTNDHGSRSNFWKMVDDMLRLKKSNVVYYDGGKYSIAASAIAYANGINMSRDKSEVYVASCTGGTVLVYTPEGNTLIPKDTIELKTGADNIELDEAGNLWVGCHPKLLTFIGHTGDTSKPSPSQVFKLTRNEKGSFTAEEIFLSKGDDLSGSSVAAVIGKTMLIGSVMDNGILRCEMK